MLKIYYKKILLFLTFVFISLGSFAQLDWGLPFIETYDDEKNPLKNKVIWDIYQAESGEIFFASTTLAVFDGATWRKIDVGNSVVTKISYNQKQDRIYIGTQNSFGYLKLKKTGLYEYVNISEPEFKDNFKIVWSVLNTDNRTYFFVDKKDIYVYENDRLDKVQTKSLEINRGFIVENKIFAVSDKSGIYEIENKNLHKVPNTDSIAVQSIRGMLTRIIHKKFGKKGVIS